MRIISFDNAFINLLENINEYFTKSSNSIHQARNEIKIIKYENKDLVVKSFKIPNFINKLVYTFFKDSKAKKSYENSVKIIDFVPTPIGYVEFKSYGLLSNSYFVSENFKYDFTIREPLLDSDFIDREIILKEFANFSFRLHENDILHLDYSPGNILIKKSTNGFTFKIVDINRMAFKKLSLNQRLQNLSMLWAKDEDMKIIAKQYAKLLAKSEDMIVDLALKYSQKHKDRKNFKKRLKGKKVVD